MTTRKHPRTTLEAWPDRAPGSIAHYRRPLQERVLDVILTVLFSGALGVAIFYYLSEAL